ncbi:hypothetical protein QTH91_21390 [Variovorax dokdonensis]|uniref:DUF4148 domain-containing protein n=1 Tax=Variovorax dokdonensis TaxID=344883 RepID=A0ABT7NGV2_9BURK|nr:hypothetical protein [Variovorax dokdonensis]MDM0047060.1 hypothetical protein [Variovorax dokdonensis]
MRNLFISAGLVCAAATLATGAALAQQQPMVSDGGDYRPMAVSMSERPEVAQGARDAARTSNGAGTESIGSSTSLPLTSGVGADLAARGALESARASNGAGSEVIGGSTSPMPLRGAGG